MLFGKCMTPMICAQGISWCHRIRIKNNINDQNFLKKDVAQVVQLSNN